jgi:hypothetical protein
MGNPGSMTFAQHFPHGHHTSSSILQGYSAILFHLLSKVEAVDPFQNHE